jgi:hypothetical protein
MPGVHHHDGAYAARHVHLAQTVVHRIRGHQNVRAVLDRSPRARRRIFRSSWISFLCVSRHVKDISVSIVCQGAGWGGLGRWRGRWRGWHHASLRIGEALALRIGEALALRIGEAFCLPTRQNASRIGCERRRGTRFGPWGPKTPPRSDPPRREWLRQRRVRRVRRRALAAPLPTARAPSQQPRAPRRSARA